jgi:hypothetical protein
MNTTGTHTLINFLTEVPAWLRENMGLTLDDLTVDEVVTMENIYAEGGIEAVDRTVF